jgi:hypothetical protein
MCIIKGNNNYFSTARFKRWLLHPTRGFSIWLANRLLVLQLSPIRQTRLSSLILYSFKVDWMNEIWLSAVKDVSSSKGANASRCDWGGDSGWPIYFSNVTKAHNFRSTQYLHDIQYINLHNEFHSQTIHQIARSTFQLHLPSKLSSSPPPPPTTACTFSKFWYKSSQALYCFL